MKLFDLLDHLLDKVQKTEIIKRSNYYKSRKNIGNTARWIFIAIVIIVGIKLSKTRSSDDAVPLFIILIICFILAWISYIYASKASIKFDLMDLLVSFKDGSRENFLKLIINEDKGDENLVKTVSETMIDLFDNARSEENFKDALNEYEFKASQKKGFMTIFREIKKAIVLFVEDFNLQLPT
jgi:hypothetical protein